ncbi:MAG: glycosyltransferase family 2 protein [Pseudomonadota bacterium]
MTPVSVVSVFHNRAALVAPTLDTLRAQTHPALEIVVVDDGSSDGTGEAMADYASAHADPRLTVRRHANMGFVNALNAAIRATDAPYVAIHGSGDTADPTRIARQAAVLDADDAVGLVGCWVSNEDPITGAATIKRPKLAGPLREIILRHNPFTHGEVVYRRALFDRVGGYRPFFRVAQDRDLWVRMSRETDHAIVPEVLYHRRRLSDGIAASPAKLVLQSRLSDFAVHCGVQVLAGRPDPLERDGPAAFDARPGSPRLAERFARIAVSQACAGRPDDARLLIAAAREEVITPTVRLADWLIRAARHDGLRDRIVAPLLRSAKSVRARRAAPASKV